jgi:kumamolisin
MKTQYSIASLSMVATLIGVCALTASGQTASPVVITPPSSVANPGDAGVRFHTNLQILGASPMIGAPQVSGPPYPGYFYETPASLACIYKLVTPVTGCDPNTFKTNPSGGSKAIAIVDAYDDPNAYTDLQTFSTQFGITAITPTSFIVKYAPKGGATPGSCTGSATEPTSASGTGWDVEESLDVQYSHAMAPAATLYLVEAQSDSDADLYCAVVVANGLVAAAGGGEVSMSWGGGEYSGETSADVIFKKPDVVYFAAAGDGPGVEYPSTSPHVVAVGGTSLSTNSSTGDFISENTWQSGGGGVSKYEAKPTYQDGVTGITSTSTKRHVPDVSFDANPDTGVWVLDTLTPPGGWYLVGGTSVGTPTNAGIVNAAGGFAASSEVELTTMYASSGFTDIKSGDCGPYMSYFAKAGWDFCTGLGSPKGYSGK